MTDWFDEQTRLSYIPEKVQVKTGLYNDCQNPQEFKLLNNLKITNLNSKEYHNGMITIMFIACYIDFLDSNVENMCYFFSFFCKIWTCELHIFKSNGRNPAFAILYYHFFMQNSGSWIMKSYLVQMYSPEIRNLQYPGNFALRSSFKKLLYK